MGQLRCQIPSEPCVSFFQATIYTPIRHQLGDTITETTKIKQKAHLHLVKAEALTTWDPFLQQGTHRGRKAHVLGCATQLGLKQESQ